MQVKGIRTMISIWLCVPNTMLHYLWNTLFNNETVGLRTLKDKKLTSVMKMKYLILEVLKY